MDGSCLLVVLGFASLDKFDQGLGRNMRRWDTEIPVIRAQRPDLQILSCHDEYLLHTSFVLRTPFFMAKQPG
jgi:hypothetical protein